MQEIFALDIGTRTVIGCLMEVLPDNRLRVSAQYLKEHNERSMLDGQIHNIPAVAAAVREVKEALEQQSGKKLYQVAIAAAGRSLVTRRCRVEMAVETEEIEPPHIYALETEGIKQALAEVATAETQNGRLHCVGYSVISYFLDGYAISNLEGHRGRTIGADMVVTFLPESVVTSLYAVLRRVGLEPLNLTLEPIAAMEVAVPATYRLLNLALVDIGAGTSDIAISSDGAVTAYGMVPIAGDEISEELMQALLVDFSTAEDIKRQLGQKEEIVYRDILGIENSIPAGAVREKIAPAVERLAREIATEILNLNGGKPPRAVFLVGGGAQLPDLPAVLARELSLDVKRVVVRRRSELQHPQLLPPGEGEITGPEGITVLGIALVGFKRLGYDFLSVYVNGVEQRLFYTGELTVGQVLKMTGFDPHQLLGRNGSDLTFTLNGEKRVIYGELARPAVIRVNDRAANLKTAVRNGDRIEVVPAVSGKSARLRVGDLLPRDGQVVINYRGQEYRLRGGVWRGGQLLEEDEEISNNDELLVASRLTISEWLAMLGESFIPGRYLINGRVVEANYRLQPGDVITRKEVNGNKGAEHEIRVRFNGRPVILRGKKEYILADILAVVDIDPTSFKGTFKVFCNGEEAGFITPLKDGDDIVFTAG